MIRDKSLRSTLAVLGLTLLLLGSCGFSAASPGAASPSVATQAPSVVVTVVEPLETSPAASATSAPGSRLDGLSEAQAKTLESLTQVDDYPLYTMTYYGAYDTALLPTGSSGIRGFAWACSLFAALAPDQGKLYGRNFDWRFSPALLLFTDPPSGYASVSVVDIAYLVDEAKVGDLADLPLTSRIPLLETPFWPFDGMNERGLAVGMAAVPEQPLPHDPGKETIGSLAIIREMLDHASNVDQALEAFRSYNLAWEGGPALHYLVADSSGSAVLVEFYNGEMVVLPNEESWHLATNHLRAEANETGIHSCQRYDRLQERLAETGGRLGIEEAVDLLADVAQPNTQWSVVYGLDDKDVRVVMGRAYDEVHSFALGAGPWHYPMIGGTLEP